MNICFLSETSAWGGGEVHTLGLAETLADRGHDVHLVALGHDVFDELAACPGCRFTVHKVPLTGPAATMKWSECTTLMRRLPDGIGVLVRWGLHVGSLRLDLAARRHFQRYLAIEHSAAVLEPRASKRHCCGLVPGLGLWWYQSRLLWWLRSIIPERVVCVSHGARQRMIDEFRVPSRKLATIHGGIDLETFQPSHEARSVARRAWGVSDEAFVFGSVGRLHADKGLDVAIEAFGHLVARHPQRDLRLVLAGDGPAREALMQAAQTAGVAERVVFPGFTSEPWKAYPGFDVFVMPTRDEALGLALIEALACGCVAVAMSVGGVPEVIADPAMGWLVPAGDREQFLVAMEKALQLDAADRAAMSRAAREHVAACFDAERQYAALADLIEQNDAPIIRDLETRTRLPQGVTS